MKNDRLTRLREEITNPLLLENPTDLFYLTGMHFSKGRLFVTKDATTLFVDGRYFEQAKKQDLCSVENWDDFKKIQASKVHFDSSFVSYQNFLALKKLLPNIGWLPLPNPLKDMRAVKDFNEIEALKKAAKLTLKGIEHVFELAKEGISEAELAFEFESFVRKAGAQKLSFEPIVAFGENSAYPHHRAGSARLEKDQVILVDAGAQLNEYCGDLTRIFYLGKPNPEIKRLEEIVKEAQETALSRVRPGVLVKELDHCAREVFEKENVKPLYKHSLGHGVGLEVHEFPVLRVNGAESNTALKEGMVITIEPGLYQPNVGGIRLEEMIVVTASGFENLLEPRLA